MDKPMSNIIFRGMSFIFRLRDINHDPVIWLEEAGIMENMTVVDYGCGPGAYSIAAGKLMKNTGHVIAIDIQPLALKMVMKRAKKHGLTNISTLMPTDKTGLPSESVDIVLLYDVFHMFSQKDEILKEIHRILKPDGRLSLNDHHMKQATILDTIKQTGLFNLEGKEIYTLKFKKG